MNTYLHHQKLSPDPSYEHLPRKSVPGGYIIPIYPNACIRIFPSQAIAWQKKLKLTTPPPPVILRPDSNHRIDMCLDFGTELEAALFLTIKIHSSFQAIFISFGESIPEAEGYGMPTTNPLSTVEWYAQSRGLNKYQIPQRGFRFIRIQMPEINKPVEIITIRADAWFAFKKRYGDFQCDNPQFQRLWQTSVYTARLCTRPDCYWDGIKRDRFGWFGDARITQMTTDAVFADPEPAAKMLLSLPTNNWTMGIPGYTFSAIAMFHQLILCYGKNHPCVPQIYNNIREVLKWVKKTQLNSDGFITRKAGINYFGKVAFIDWSPMPVGGKFEELSWLQCQHLEALLMAARIATWLNHPDDAEKYSKFAAMLAKNIRRKFWRQQYGLIHTLNQTIRKWKPLVVLPLPLERDNEYRYLYFRLPPIGESIPSRHSQTMAVLAGIVQNQSEKNVVLRTLRSNRYPPLITAYFRYFEAVARSECGDATGAIKSFISYLAEQVELNDSAALWEWYDPKIRDFRRWGLGDWPKSLCHGWSTGIVPLTQYYLLGVKPIAPGFSKITINPSARLPISFEAAIPTPHGNIKVIRESPSSPIRHILPSGIICT